MAEFLDEVVSYTIEPKPQILQELVEPEKKIPETANNEVEATK